MPRRGRSLSKSPISTKKRGSNSITPLKNTKKTNKPNKENENLPQPTNSNNKKQNLNQNNTQQQSSYNQYSLNNITNNINIINTTNTNYQDRFTNSKIKKLIQKYSDDEDDNNNENNDNNNNLFSFGNKKQQQYNTSNNLNINTKQTHKLSTDSFFNENSNDVQHHEQFHHLFGRKSFINDNNNNNENNEYKQYEPKKQQQQQNNNQQNQQQKQQQQSNKQININFIQNNNINIINHNNTKNNNTTNNNKNNKDEDYDFYKEMEKKYQNKMEEEVEVDNKEENNKEQQYTNLNVKNKKRKKKGSVKNYYQTQNKKLKTSNSNKKQKKKNNFDTDNDGSELEDEPLSDCSEYDVTADLPSGKKRLNISGMKRKTRNNSQFNSEDNDDEEKDMVIDLQKSNRKSAKKNKKSQQQSFTTSEDDATDDFMEDDQTPKILKGYKIFVDVCSPDGEETNGPFLKVLKDMGATIRKKITKTCTLIVWKDGDLNNYNAAKELKIPIVQTLWVDECYDSFTLSDYKLHLVKELSDTHKKKLDDNKKKKKYGAKTEAKPEPQKKLKRINETEAPSSKNNLLIQQLQQQNETKDLDDFATDIFQQCIQNDMEFAQLNINFEQPNFGSNISSNRPSHSSQSTSTNNQPKKQVSLSNYFQNNNNNNNNVKKQPSSSSTITNQSFVDYQQNQNKKNNIAKKNSATAKLDLFKFEKKPQQQQQLQQQNSLQRQESKIESQFIISVDKSLNFSSDDKLQKFFKPKAQNFKVVKQSSIKDFFKGGILVVEEKLQANLVHSIFTLKELPIVQKSWVEDCTNEGKFANYKSFQLNSKKINQNLLGNLKYFVYLEGEPGNKITVKKAKPPIIQDLENKVQQEKLIELLGGKLVKKEENFKSADCILFQKQQSIPSDIPKHIKCVKIQWLYDMVLKNEYQNEKMYNLRV